MVYSIVKNVQKALQYRGGVRGLLEHMYTNGDYPFKFGTYMGCDAAGNRYYENRVDYSFGQHRWVEPGDIHNFDSASIQPEWQGWMTSMNDAPPHSADDFFAEGGGKLQPMCESDAPAGCENGYSMVGHTDPHPVFHHLHNQSQVRSRGYGIGNHVVGLPPGVKDGFYTQPGSPYNDASIRPLNMIGNLDKDGGRAYKSEKWAERLTTEEEKKAVEQQQMAEVKKVAMGNTAISRKEMAMRSRGVGTTL